MFVFTKIIIENYTKIFLKYSYFWFGGLYSPIINHFWVRNVISRKTISKLESVCSAASSLQVIFSFTYNNRHPPKMFLPPWYVLYGSIENWWFVYWELIYIGKLWSIFVSETRKMSNLDLPTRQLKWIYFLMNWHNDDLLWYCLGFLTYNFLLRRKASMPYFN